MASAPATAQVEAPPLPTQKTLYFVRTFRNYAKGDVAGFPVAYANQLVEKGVAR
jgi:hypothetical protein